ncbi:pyridoxamine 5'-phosphate oxidase family protein [Rhizobium sp. BK418]|uniref:pyridoxamine 5'-phosphate oxidase family protein n=1 Tax=Rhizobium sp. BK418 TaxID=2512120 RepID=UPI001046B8CF|nr:pyridoxamine 5'-phosphate oxidase family protein [Rhizobium sp. BK418]TCS00645.1 general stress protein 26 [Rhizobium sp. BK418]
MASFSEAREQPARQLWDQINDIHAGMLSLAAVDMHMQPMAPNVDPTTNTIWFYTKTDAELVQMIKPGSRAHFCVIGKNHDYHACLSGVIEVRPDPLKIEEYWNSIVAAWYEGGKKDPKLTMLAMHVDDADIWVSTGSTLKFGWEIAKANFDEEKMADVGIKRHLQFA